MPLWLQILFFGALLSVIMSTASGTLLAPAVTFTENVVKGQWPGMSDRQLLAATRWAVSGFTLIVLTYALLSNATIHQMVENAYRVTLAGAFVPLAFGLFWRRATSFGATMAVVTGLGVWLFGELFFPPLALPPHLIAMGVAAVVMVVASLFGPHERHPRPPARHPSPASATHHVPR
jgi:Na+/proline symporter